jgi:hypothetical protein
MTKQLLSELTKPYLINLSMVVIFALKYPDRPAYEIMEQLESNGLPIDEVEKIVLLTEPRQIELLEAIASALRSTNN